MSIGYLVIKDRLFFVVNWVYMDGHFAPSGGKRSGGRSVADEK